MVQYSVVVPVHNEEGDVAELARRVQQTLGPDCEILFIDDGSTDRTWDELCKLAVPGRVRLIKFRANFGKAAALMAGFAATRGEIVFTMDGDLQDDPDEIPRFLEKLGQGHDLVCGFKKTRHDPWTKVVASRIFNFVVRKLTKLELHDMNCGFKCYRGELARRVRIYGELHRYIPVLAAHMGYKITEIEVKHHRRLHGRSKYGAGRLFKGFVDLITVLLTSRYATRPAHPFGAAGAVCFLLAAICSIATVVAHGRSTAIDILGLGLEPAILAMMLGLKALFFSLAAVTLFAVGWLAEVAVAPGLRSNSSTTYDIEEQVG